VGGSLDCPVAHSIVVERAWALPFTAMGCATSGGPYVDLPDPMPTTPRTSRPTKAHMRMFTFTPKAALERATVPQLLYLHSPNGQKSCAGTYRLAADEANGNPVWKLVGKERWLFSCPFGMWLIGGADVKATNFNHVAGFIYAVVAHHGCITPDQFRGTWKWWDGSQFKDDNNICMVRLKGSAKHQDMGDDEHNWSPSCFSSFIPESTPTVPLSPRGHHDGASAVELEPLSRSSTKAAPVHQSVPPLEGLGAALQGLSTVMFDHDAQGEGASLTLKPVGLPRMPLPSSPPGSPRGGGGSKDKVDTPRMIKALIRSPSLDSGRFPSRRVSRMLRVNTPNGQRSCNGLYIHQTNGEEVNDLPIWKHIKHQRWIFSGRSGKWMIGGADVKAAHFERSAGFIYSEKAHEGVMPDRITGGWIRWDGIQFVRDDAITVTPTISTVYTF